jgi:hypothetical protein
MGDVDTPYLMTKCKRKKKERKKKEEKITLMVL